MKILIIGVVGWLVSELTEKFLKIGNRVKVILRKNNDEVKLLKNIYEVGLSMINFIKKCISRNKELFKI